MIYLSRISFAQIDASTGDISSREWDFDNDGTVDSTEQNPSFTYDEGGVYSVKLTVSDGNEMSVIVATLNIGVYPTKLVITPEKSRLMAGDSTLLDAQLEMSDGTTRISGIDIVYTSSDDEIASITGDVVTANKLGTVNITASADGISGYAVLEVISETASVTLSADGNGYADGAGEHYAGEAVLVSAVPHDGEEFIGWYNGTELVSADADYSFVVTDDILLTAKFTKREINIDTKTLTVTCKDGCKNAQVVAATYKDGKLVDIVICKADLNAGDNIINVDELETANADTAKVMILNSMANLIPVYKASLCEIK